jgi:uncharacterized membrane protein YfcA
MTLDVVVITTLFGTGLVAGFVDSIAGGGGLITLPVLLSLGIPPKHALGTNKLQSSFGSGSATWRYSRGNWLDFRNIKNGVLFTFSGAVLGTLLVQMISSEFLRLSIPVLLVAIALYLLFSPKLGAKETKQKMNSNFFYPIFGLGLGFYDGFFGPGTGTFWTMAYILLLGFPFTKATGQTKLMNFTSNVASLIVFFMGKHVMISAGLIMGAGQFFGAILGAKTALKRGITIIRPLFITAVCLIALKIIYQSLRN